MEDKNRYMFCCDCGYAFKRDDIFIKAYTNTAICLCRECALKLAQEISDKYVDIRETQKAEAGTGEVASVSHAHWVYKRRRSGGWRRRKGIDVKTGELVEVFVDEREDDTEAFCSACGVRNEGDTEAIRYMLKEAGFDYNESCERAKKAMEERHSVQGE